MKVKVAKREMEISQVDLVHARAAVNSFVEAAKNGSMKAGRPSLYLTTLLLMYKKGADLLNAMGIDEVQRILSEIN